MAKLQRVHEESVDQVNAAWRAQVVAARQGGAAAIAALEAAAVALQQQLGKEAAQAEALRAELEQAHKVGRAGREGRALATRHFVRACRCWGSGGTR